MSAKPLLPLLVCSWGLQLTQPAAGQDLLLKGATVHTVSGETLSPGQVLIHEGKVASVAATVVANGASVVDLTGQHLYPGLIALDSGLGLTEIESVRGTDDAEEVGEFTPDVRSWIAVNPDSELLPVARANGIAYFEPVPSGSLVSGQSALMAIEGWTSEDMTVRKPIALHLFWPNMDLDVAERPAGKEKPKSLEEQTKERRSKVQAITDFFAEARAYARAVDAVAKGSAPALQRVPAWEAMLPYLHGDLPIMINADEIRGIRAAVAWSSTNGLKMILVGGRDAWMAAALLAEKHVPVIYSHVFTLPPRDTASYDVQFGAPGVLHQAGVTVALSMGRRTFDAPFARNLPYAAAQAVAFGLPEPEALKALTIIPAQLAGVADRLGSIEPGKEATLVCTEGDILDIRSHVSHLWMAGKETSLNTRHTRLYEKYKSRPRKENR